MPRVRDLWFRILIGWYRLTGSTQVQAEWKARHALKAPGAAQDKVKAHTERAADKRFNCVCGQLLMEEDRVCHACGRRQYLPYWARGLLKLLGISRPSGTPGTFLVGFLMAVGYAIQTRYGEGGFMSPSQTWLELTDLGASISWMTLGPHPWRSLTYTLLHGGLWHIGFNLLALGIIGPIVERRFGTARFLFCWVLGGSLAALLPPFLGFLLNAPLVGASGAVSALIGIALVQGHREGTFEGRQMRNQMFTWMVYTTLFGLFIGNVAHSAHFAGFGVGGALAWLLPPADGSPTRRRITLPLGLLGVAGLASALVGWGLWFADGARPPKSVRGGPTPDFWYVHVAEARGPEKAFGAEAAALLDAAQTKPGLAPTGEQAGRLAAVMRAMGYFERLAFARKLPPPWQLVAVGSIDLAPRE